MVDLAGQPEVQYVRATYKVNRWGHGASKPLFGMYLFAQETQARAEAKTA
jgi:hypothetical protein